MTDPRKDGRDAEKGRPGKGVPVTAVTWAPEPPALDLDPVPDNGRHAETEVDDPGAPPARSGKSQWTEDPAKANSETGGVPPSSRVPPEVVGNRPA